MAAIANLTIDQGTTFTSDVTVKDANNNPFDLTGYTAEAKMSKGYSSTRTRTSITTTIAADATTGVVTLSLTSTVSAGLDAERYVYDLEITQTSSGNVTRVIEGIITVRPQVSMWRKPNQIQRLIAEGQNTSGTARLLEAPLQSNQVHKTLQKRTLEAQLSGPGGRER